MEGIWRVGPLPVSATCRMAWNRSRVLSGAVSLRDSSKRPRYCNSRLALKPKKSGVQIARNLLREDGVIFVSIDDNEVYNLRLIMNEIFGEENFVASIVWSSKSGGANDSKNVAVDHEYLLLCAKES